MRSFAKGVVVGTVATAILMSATGLAAGTLQSIPVTFAPLRYIFDGTEKTPPPTTPGFIYNNTTYVPLRFVVESVGKRVGWDGATSTVTVTTPSATQTTAPTPTPAPTPAEPTERPDMALYVNSQPYNLLFGPLVQAGTHWYVPWEDVTALLPLRSAGYDSEAGAFLYSTGAKQIAVSAKGIWVDGALASNVGLEPLTHAYLPLDVLAELLGGSLQEQSTGVDLTGF